MVGGVPGNKETSKDRPGSVPGPARTKTKTCSTPDIRVHFVAVPTQCSAKSKRTRDVQVHSQGEPSLKKQKALEAIAGLLCNHPWLPGTTRKRKRTMLVKYEISLCKAVPFELSEANITYLRSIANPKATSEQRLLNINRYTETQISDFTKVESQVLYGLLVSFCCYAK